jgi:eukaryotic-like serine/threonine-protein kinase
VGVDMNKAQELFNAAIERRQPAEWDAFLAQACGSDEALRRYVVQLLECHQASAIKSSPHNEDSGRTAVYVGGSVERIGAVIAGRYKLLEQIGEGGMGSVWVAEQLHPVRRKVALKLVKAGMDSKAVLARFEAERQALALMDHPNIARVLDGGVTEQGRPFFVMDYVKGVPITEFCDSARLSVTERLRLFAQTCSAVQHAHQKGVIHRDLKPSNILVAPYDGTPVPKVIDFGLAKAIHQPLTDRTLHTAHETVLGTPLYMSPEQAQLNNLDVDTRSDVYSLGVLMYELLTGTTPLEKQRFERAAWDEVRRIIREEEPPRPSTRLSTTETLPSLAACRQTEPALLTRQVRGELDWIVMKALEKDRNRRYETADNLAADVMRYLAGDPVTAVPPSAGYRLRKFVRRNRATVTWVAILLALLIAFSGFSIFLAFEADRGWREAIAANGKLSAKNAELERQRTLAEIAAANESKQRQLADSFAQKAQANFRTAREAVDRMLTRAGDETFRDVPGLEQLRRQILQDALEFHRGFLRVAHQDATVRFDAASAYHSVAEILKDLDNLTEAEDSCDKATQLFEQLLSEAPDDHKAQSKLAACLKLQAELHEAAGKAVQVEPLLRRAIEILEGLVQQVPQHIQYERDLLSTYVTLYRFLRTDLAKSEPLLQRAQALMQKLAVSDGDRGTLFAALRLYMLAWERGGWNYEKKVETSGKLIEAMTAARSKLNRPDADDSLVTLRAHRAEALAKLGRKEEAKRDLEIALETGKKLVSDFPSIPKYLLTLSSAYENQADILTTQKDYAGAEEAYRQALGTREQLVKDHPANLEWQVAKGITQVKLGLAVVGLQLGNAGSGLQFALSKRPPEVLMRALDWHDGAVQTLSEVLRRDPRNSEARHWLTQAYQWRGATWMNWEDPIGAEADYNAALEIADAKNQTVLRMLRWSASNDGTAAERLTHADRMARRGKHETAFNAVEKTTREELEGTDTYNAACVVALCAAAARADGRLAPIARDRLGEQYTLRSVALLRQAVARGFKDRTHLKQDEDLKAIRGHPEYQKFSEEIESLGSTPPKK